jgi:hypothetical protein
MTMKVASKKTWQSRTWGAHTWNSGHWRGNLLFQPSTGLGLRHVQIDGGDELRTGAALDMADERRRYADEER